MYGKKPRYLRKETLAGNILRGCFFPEDLKKLDWAVRMAYQSNDKELQKYKDRTKKFKELYEELIDEPVKFVEKYGKKSKNKRILQLLKENPDIFKSKEIYSKLS